MGQNKYGGGGFPTQAGGLAMAGDSPRSFAGERGRCASTFWRGGGGLSGTRIGPRCVSGRLGATSGLTIGGGHRRGRQSGRGRQQGTMAPICKTSSLRSRKRICLACVSAAVDRASHSFLQVVRRCLKQLERRQASQAVERWLAKSLLRNDACCFFFAAVGSTAWKCALLRSHASK